ncbi:hypothetical protein NS115_22640 [Paenibacillus jamilae]|uniref:Uncharacterized protein n=1 Tax=Paenibacillus jamilae TaxID=114136 RepID=A0ACC4ZP43_9BACL|nr:MULTISPECIES: hypothetical protein [Paenibacillus]AUO07935.1 hypothetical protein C0638_16050 [Paenibacillus sp. lzh-N1]KTS78571.1 hypothetical protein NS115_22640 [Paenibacillus jamilae]
MKKLTVFMLVLCCFSILSACSTDPVKKDLITYVNDGMLPLAQDEKAVTEKYESVTGDNFTDDEILYNTLRDDIIPEYTKYLDKVEAVKTETPEVRAVHETYIKAVSTQKEALITMVDALEKGDLNLINEGNTKLSEGKKLFRDFGEQVNTLAKEHDVKINKK